MPGYFDIDRLYTTKGQEKNFDTEPKAGSVNYISSGSVYTAIQELKTAIKALETRVTALEAYHPSEVSDDTEEASDETITV